MGPKKKLRVLEKNYGRISVSYKNHGNSSICMVTLSNGLVITSGGSSICTEKAEELSASVALKKLEEHLALEELEKVIEDLNRSCKVFKWAWGCEDEDEEYYRVLVFPPTGPAVEYVSEIKNTAIMMAVEDIRAAQIKTLADLLL